MCVLTVCIYYVIAKVQGYVLLDVDFVPLQEEYWQTDQMLSAHFSLLSARFSTPNSRKINLDFTTMGAIVTCAGVEQHLNKGTPLPMKSVGRSCNCYFGDQMIMFQL